MGMESVPEAFADRAYLADGRLVPRSETGSVLTDAATVAWRAVAIATDRTVTAIDGSEGRIEARSICINGDAPHAVAIARAVRAGLEGASVNIQAFAV
jgi:UPF0271 protein